MLISSMAMMKVKLKMVLRSLMTKWLFVADEDGEVVVTPLFQDVVEVVVVATLVVDDLYDVARDDVLKDLVRADVDHVVVDGVDELLDLLVVDAVALVAELFVDVLSDADLDVSSLVDILVDSLSLS